MIIFLFLKTLSKYNYLPKGQNCEKMFCRVSLELPKKYSLLLGFCSVGFKDFISDRLTP